MDDDSSGEERKGPADTAEVFALKEAVFARDVEEIAKLLLQYEYSVELLTFALDMSQCVRRRQRQNCFTFGAYFWKLWENCNNRKTAHADLKLLTCCRHC
jgi:hypothetical protein